MNTLKRAACAALLLGGTPLVAGAAIAQKPGLWTLSVELTRAVPDLDPALLEQMEMMGLQIPTQPIHSSTHEICLTPEQVRLDRLPDIHDAESGCTARNIRRVGDRATGELVCAGALQGRGRLQITLTSAQDLAGSATFEGASQEGFPIFANGALRGRWLSASCGEVQPFEIPAGAL